MNRHFFILGVIAAAVFFPLQRNARAEGLVCTCEEPTCGNGVTAGTKGKVYSDVPALSAERMFGPSRTGADKTGWVCKTKGAEPVVRTTGVYTCTCTRARCGGGAIMPGVEREQQKQLAGGLVSATFRPYLTGDEATGWTCVNEKGEPFPKPPAPVAAEPAPAPLVAATPPADPRQRYTCSCTLATCGGKDGITPGERGQQHMGISLPRLPKYGAGRAEATGWTCKAEAPPPKYACTCERDLCGGQDGVLEGERGQRHTGISGTQLPKSYGPERTGAVATGWTCAEERVQAAAPARPAPAAVPAANVLVATVDPGYVCRCAGKLGCGVGGAPFGKRGEVREGVPGAHINELYHSDKPDGWVCSRPAGAVLPPGADPGYVCRCQGILGCGVGGAPFAKRGEVREGVPADHIDNLYHSNTPGGWVCSIK